LTGVVVPTAAVVWTRQRYSSANVFIICIVYRLVGSIPIDEEKEHMRNFNRRNFLRAVGGTAGAGTLGLTGVQGASAEDQTEVEELPNGEANQQLRYAMSVQEAGELRQRLIDEGYRPDPSNVAAMSIETEDQELNDVEPISVFLPFEQRNGDGMGLVNVLVVDDRDGNRTAGAGWASTVEPSEDTKSEDDHRYHTKAFVWNDETGEVAVLDENTVDMTDSVSVQSLPDVPNVITAAACLAAISEVCMIYGSGVSRPQCVSLCWRTLNPAAVIGCSGLCFAITAVLNRYGCGKSGAFLCGALGFSV
jgi:hypothetical protein